MRRSRSYEDIMPVFLRKLSFRPPKNLPLSWGVLEGWPLVLLGPLAQWKVFGGTYFEQRSCQKAPMEFYGPSKGPGKSPKRLSFLFSFFFDASGGWHKSLLRPLGPHRSFLAAPSFNKEATISTPWDPTGHIVKT